MGKTYPICEIVYTCMMVIASFLFHETPTIAQGKAKGNSWCRGKQ